MHDRATGDDTDAGHEARRSRGASDEFHRRVLDYLPSPILVIDDQARITYANLAALEVSGRSPQELVGSNAFDLVHPDDLGWATEVFTNVVELGPNPLERSKAGGIHFRVVTATGEPVPVHITGALGFGDPHVRGIVYDVRPDWGPALLSRIFAGLAHGQSVDELLGLVTELVAAPPVPVDVALVDLSLRSEPRTMSVTDASFADLAPHLVDVLAGRSPGESVAARVAVLSADERAPLEPRGYDVVWHVPVLSDAATGLHLVAACRDGLRYEMTVRERMAQAADLASVVLLRADHDARVLHAATHDSLTGLPNRRAWYAHVEQQVADDLPVALLYVDLDGFKPINDRYGHATGDAVLIEIAGRLRTNVRVDDLVARIGGDEFAVCLAGPIDSAAASAIAEQVAAAIEVPIRPGQVRGVEEDLVVRGSIGVATSRPDIDSEALLAAADRAMYESKRRGRGVIGR